MRLKGNDVGKVLSAALRAGECAGARCSPRAEETDGGGRAFWAFRQHVVGEMDEKFRTQSSLNSLPFPLQSGGPFQAEWAPPQWPPFSCLAGQWANAV